jgi:hypothetical protein
MRDRVRRRHVGDAAGTGLREVRLTIADAYESSVDRSVTTGVTRPRDRSATDHDEPDATFWDRRRMAHERRDVTSRAVLVERFRAEFRGMPGLWISRSEARRLFGVPEDICQRVLDVLVGEGTLIRTSGGIYRTPPAIGGRHQ